MERNQLLESMVRGIIREELSMVSWFGNSVVCNSDGSPKKMYRGGKAGGRIEFDRGHSRRSNLYGTGFYFTDDIHQASVYGSPTAYYLKIEEPLRTDAHTITAEEVLRFLRVIDDNEDYGLYNYGYGSTPESVLRSVYSEGKSDFGILFDINSTCIGDMVECVLLFNRVNGRGYDGFILDSETVVFDGSQIRKA